MRSPTTRAPPAAMPCRPSSPRAKLRFSSESSPAASTSRSPTTWASASRRWRRTAPTSWKSSTPIPSPTCSRSRWARTRPRRPPLPPDRMAAQVLDGNALARKIRAEVAGRTQALKARGIQPHLAIVLVGEDPASQVYTRHKGNDSPEPGLSATLERYPATMDEGALLARIHELNDDPKVHGIL